MSRCVALLHNQKSGRAAVLGSEVSTSDIVNKLDEHGIEALVVDIEKNTEELIKTIKDRGVEAVVAAGGDGTINAAARIAVQNGVSLAVLPLGTRNHFAKDIGIPLKLEEAIETIVAAHTCMIDYCSVNDRIFVNNASIGLYPVSVSAREELEPKLGKGVSTLVSTVGGLMKIKSTHLTVEVDGSKHTYKTPLLFVGNNTYELERAGMASRDDLANNELFLYVIRANTASAVLRMAFLNLFGKRIREHDRALTTKQDITVTSKKSKLKVALDGEVITLSTPLIYKLHHEALTVYCPV